MTELQQSGFQQSEPAEPSSYDAFGFPSDQRYLPSSLSAATTRPLGVRWAKWWHAVTADGHIPRSLQRTAELEELVWTGIPSAFRGTVWILLLDVRSRSAQSPPDYYQGLLRSASRDASTAAGDETPTASASRPAKLARGGTSKLQIAKDVDRTWPRHRWLDSGALQRVLVAFSQHNASIGYCQGLNSIAACFLLFMGEVDAFWCLVQLTEARLPAGWWVDTLWRSSAENEVLKALVARREPKLTRWMQQSRLVLELFSTQWLVTILISDLPLETALRVWDVLFFTHTSAAAASPEAVAAGPAARGRISESEMAGDGPAVLLAASLALLRTLRPHMRRHRGLGAFSEGLRSGPRTLQPGSRAGEAFSREMRKALAWLEARTPLGQLREAAVAKVRARLELVQMVRDGLAPAAELHAQLQGGKGGIENGPLVSVEERIWRRLRFRRHPAPRGKPSSGRLHSVATERQASHLIAPATARSDAAPGSERGRAASVELADLSLNGRAEARALDEPADGRADGASGGLGSWRSEEADDDILRASI